MGLFDSYKDISGYNSIFHSGDPYKKAKRPVNEAWNQSQEFQKPYWQHGLDEYGNLNTAENRLLNPMELTNEWSKGYEESPFAKQLLQENQNQGMDAASSMGLMGSSAAINNIQQGAGKIMNADRREYLNDLMQKYMTGIGIGQNIYNTGANIGTNLGNQSMEHGRDLSGLEYGQQAAPTAMLGKLMGSMVDLGTNYMSGGMYGAGKGAMGAMGGSGGGGNPSIGNNSYINY